MMAPLPAREPLPTCEEWLAALDLKREGREWHGACPLCDAGEDRFRVMPDGRAFCRVCLPKGGPRFGELLRTVFPDRYDADTRRTHVPLAGDRTGNRSRGPRESLPRRPKTTPERAPRPAPADDAQDPKAALVARLWAATVPADATPGRHYLALRFAWPPAGIGPELPATVRWLAREAAPGRDAAAKWYGLPDGAAGVLAFAWRCPGDADPRAVSLEALAAAGKRIEPRWRRTFGTRAGTAFEARAPSSEADTAHVAEGEADALALAVAPWCAPGGVYAAGGTTGMRTDPERFTALSGGPVVLHADGKPQGAAAASYAKARIQATGRECRIERYAPRGEDGDPAAALAGWIGERAAIREFEGGATRDDADRGAWHDLLRGTER